MGVQCAKKIARGLSPSRVVIASLFRKETREAVAALRKSFPKIQWQGYYGNLFVRGEPATIDHRVLEPTPREFADDPANRQAIFEDLFGDFDRAYRESFLARLIRKEKPDAVVDTVNTATGISYQDIFSSSFVVSRGLEEARGNGTVPIVSRPTWRSTSSRERSRSSSCTSGCCIAP